MVMTSIDLELGIRSTVSSIPSDIMMSISTLDEHTLEDLYMWIDSIPLTRPKKDFKRDFSDGVLVAEVVKHFYPHFVDLHNYQSAQATSNKTANWHTLNRKVFRRFGFEVSDDIVSQIVACRPTAIEQFLIILRSRLNARIQQQATEPLRSQHTDIGDVEESNKQIADWLSAVGAASVPDVKSTRKARSKSPFVKTAISCVTSSPVRESRDTVTDSTKEQITKLETKVKRLEHLLHLRDLRVADLQGRYLRLEKKYKAAVLELAAALSNN